MMFSVKFKAVMGDFNGVKEYKFSRLKKLKEVVIKGKFILMFLKDSKFYEKILKKHLMA